MCLWAYRGCSFCYMGFSYSETVGVRCSYVRLLYEAKSEGLDLGERQCQRGADASYENRMSNIACIAVLFLFMAFFFFLLGFNVLCLKKPSELNVK